MDYGPGLWGHFMSAIPYGVAIGAWWVGYEALLLLDLGTFRFPVQLVFIGAGFLCLGSLNRCVSAAQRNLPAKES